MDTAYRLLYLASLGSALGAFFAQSLRRPADDHSHTSSPAPFIGSFARRILRIAVPLSFFPRVLEHFVGFDFQIAQGFGRLFLLGIRLKQMPHGQPGCATDAQFSRQLRRWLPLHHLANEKDSLLRSEVSSFKRSSAVEIVDATTGFAPIYNQTALFGLTKSSRLLKTSFTMWAFQSIGMKMLG
ncbi:MAG: hypothetical protein M5U11_10225 [Anaerolineales bacterium]|nr:hypothetical protein [Anaerolineales bacterium]